MKSGMIAAEAVFAALKPQNPTGESANGLEVSEYQTNLDNSWVMSNLHEVRNVQPSFQYGRMFGMAYSGLTTLITKGKEPWTFKHTKKDCEHTEPASKHSRIQYPAPDGKLSFDILTNLARSGTNHEHDQPVHLKVKPELANVAESESMDVYAGPESRFCPAKVYEYTEPEDGSKPSLVINAQNCVHCKCCSIKTPKEFIQWTVPEGGGGPAYKVM